MTGSARTPRRFAITPIDRENSAQINLVAERMRDTLIEVLGPAGESLYSIAWLRERVRWHLRPDVCAGEVFLAISTAGEIVGHTIVRVEQETTGESIGLISTIFVLPSWRMMGVASALLDAAETWLLSRHPTILATDTSQTNVPLIRLFQNRKYAISFHSEEKKMVRLARIVA